LAKTPVHHYNGNNVRPSVLCSWSQRNCVLEESEYKSSGLAVSRTYLSSARDDALLTRQLQIDLGTACGKLYRCSTMVVVEPGDSDILADV
jgi:ribosomal protein L30E